VIWHAEHNHHVKLRLLGDTAVGSEEQESNVEVD
jgi:hypothetical protein